MGWHMVPLFGAVPSLHLLIWVQACMRGLLFMCQTKLPDSWSAGKFVTAKPIKTSQRPPLTSRACASPSAKPSHAHCSNTNTQNPDRSYRTPTGIIRNSWTWLIMKLRLFWLNIRQNNHTLTCFLVRKMVSCSARLNVASSGGIFFRKTSVCIIIWSNKWHTRFYRRTEKFQVCTSLQCPQHAAYCQCEKCN